MGPDALLILAGLGLSISPFIIKTAFWSIAEKVVDASDRKKIEKPLMENAYYAAHPEVKSHEEKMLDKMTGKKVAEELHFRSTSRKEVKKFNFFRSNRFDEKRDVLIHGKLKTVGTDGKIRFEDIYAYQPVLYGKGNVVLGPRKSKNGNILTQGTYACQENGQIYCGYTPKREVASNVPMDFDITSPHEFVERFPEQRSVPASEAKDNVKIQRFIQVEWDKDEQGNFKVVDLNKKEEFLKFDAYLKFHEKRNSAEYYLSKIRTARSKLYQYLQDTRPSYIAPGKVETDDLFKVIASKQPDIEKQNAEKLSKLYDLYYDEARYGVTPYGSRPNMPPMGPRPPYGGPGAMGGPGPIAPSGGPKR